MRPGVVSPPCWPPLAVPQGPGSAESSLSQDHAALSVSYKASQAHSSCATWHWPSGVYSGISPGLHPGQASTHACPALAERRPGVLGSGGASADLQSFWGTSTLARLRRLQAADRPPSRAAFPSTPSSGLAHPRCCPKPARMLRQARQVLGGILQPQRLLHHWFGVTLGKSLFLSGHCVFT